MEWFTVKYRQPNGAITEAEFEAADKSALFKLLAEKKISAVNIRAGRIGKKSGSRSAAKGASSSSSPMLIRGVIAGIVVVAGALAALWFMSHATQPQKIDTDKKVDKTKLDQLAGEGRRPDYSPIEKEKKEPVKELTEDERLLAGRDTNEWIVVTDPNTGKKHLSKLMHPGLKNQPPPYFERHSLNIIDAIQYCEMGDPLIGVEIDDRFMRDFQAALLEKIEINKDDDEDRVAHKEAMVETLKELRAELKNGGDLKSIINDALKERRRVAGLKDVMIEERARMRSEGVPDEEVVEYERACNKKLAELGAKPMITKELIIKKGRERKGLLVE